MQSFSALDETKDTRELMEKVLEPGHLALLHLVAEEAARRGLPLYLVGGFARDLLLGFPVGDFDLVVEGDAIALARGLAAKHGGRVTVHARFGTAQWSTVAAPGLPKSVDFISTRSETYPHPGALPKVKRGALADDLRRRDFTINTLAVRLDGEHFGEFHDELGGLADLEKETVRVLHPHSYMDDPTRILRAVRYEQRYGFRIAPDDLKLISESNHLLGELSGERLRHELDLILAEDKSAAMLARLAGLGVLRAIYPSLSWDNALLVPLEKLNQSEPPAWQGVPNLPHVPRRIALGYLLWLGQLPQSEIESLASRLALTAGLRDALLALSALRADLPALAGARPSAITARLDKAPLLAVCALSLESASIRLSDLKSVDEYLSHWRHVKPKTTGHALKKRGLPPGPAYQSILRRLREAWLDGEVNSAAEEAALLEDLLTRL